MRAFSGRPWLQRGVVTAAVITAVGLAGTIAFTRGSRDEQAEELREAIEGGHARNVILFLGDGMGDSEITVARNYQAGAAGRLWMDTLPLTGEYTTFALQESNPLLIDYVTDSAASGTGWATGYKTSNGRVSSVAGTGNSVTSLTTILELAQKAGLRTGNVTTAELTDATPAVLEAHINSRGCQGPADMAACAPYRKNAVPPGPGSITEQAVDHEFNVLLGGGRARFAQLITGGPDVGMTVIQSAVSKGYTYVDNAPALDMATGRHVLGLFNDGNMSLEWSGLQASASPGSGLPGGQTCSENQRPANEPSLAKMTAKAIDLLHDDDGPWSGHGPGFRHRRQKGFFLQVEGASIDKQDHVERPCEQIGETIAFDRAIKVGLDFARSHPDTLVIVTADHAHTSQIVPVPSVTDTTRPGSLSTLLTKVDKSAMTVNYGTRLHGTSQDHTGSQVRIAAKGPQAFNVVGVSDQTDLFHTMARALGLE
jgi:alkaline phosphatase